MTLQVLLTDVSCEFLRFVQWVSVFRSWQHCLHGRRSHKIHLADFPEGFLEGIPSEKNVSWSWRKRAFKWQEPADVEALPLLAAFKSMALGGSILLLTESHGKRGWCGEGTYTHSCLFYSSYLYVLPYFFLPFHWLFHLVSAIREDNVAHWYFRETLNRFCNTVSLIFFKC